MYPWYGKKNDIPTRNVVERNVGGVYFGGFKQWKMKQYIV